MCFTIETTYNITYFTADKIQTVRQAKRIEISEASKIDIKIKFLKNVAAFKRIGFVARS